MSILSYFNMSPCLKLKENIYYWDGFVEEWLSCQLPVCANGDPIRIGHAYVVAGISDYFVVTRMKLDPSFLWDESGFSNPSFVWEIFGFYDVSGRDVYITRTINSFDELVF